VTADGAIVQEHTAKGLDGLAPAKTVHSIVGRSFDPPSDTIEPRFGVIMNPYTQPPVVRQLFVSEPFSNTIAVINLVIDVTKPTVFSLGSVTRISDASLNLPVDLAPAQRDTDDPKWASNTTLDKGSDFYVANRGDNTIVRMKQDGAVVAIRSVEVHGRPLRGDDRLNGIATSPDGTKIYVTFTNPGPAAFHGILELPAFP
jgi:DNA-binding beta-propeller fold protein YncE